MMINTFFELRQWVLTVCNTIIGADFASFVKREVSNRNAGLADKRDWNIDIDP